MIAPNKQRILSKLLVTLGKTYPDHCPKELNVLDHLLLAVIQEEMSFTAALAVFRGLQSTFRDMNELRVSHPRELGDLFGTIPQAEQKARRVLSILQFVYETTYGFDLEPMKRKPLKQAQKQLSKITGTTPFAVAATVQRALGGHSLPIDAQTARLAIELQLISADDEPEQIRTGLEHLIPKAKGMEFCLLMSEWGADTANHAPVIESVVGKPKRRAKESSSSLAEESVADEADADEPSQDDSASESVAVTAPEPVKGKRGTRHRDAT